MRKILVVLLTFGLLVGSTYIFPRYDQDTVKGTMKLVIINMNKVRNALDNDDYFNSAVSLMETAKLIHSLDNVTPPKGSKEEWNKIQKMIVKTALNGICACNSENKEKVAESVEIIYSLLKESDNLFY